MAEVTVIHSVMTKATGSIATDIGLSRGEGCEVADSIVPLFMLAAIRCADVVDRALDVGTKNFQD